MDVNGSGFLEYYLRELARIEDDASHFGRRYPNVAGRLGLGISAGAADPHVRQLIESVAFIAARVKREVDGISGRLGNILVDLLAPHLVRPVPSMAVAALHLDADRDVAPVDVKRGTILQAMRGAGEKVPFVLQQDVRLWPLKLIAFWADGSDESRRYTAHIAERCLVIRLEASGRTLERFDADGVSIFIGGPSSRALRALEAFAMGCETVTLLDDGGHAVAELEPSAISVEGFDDEDRLLPGSDAISSVGNLITEYFSFPQRFCVVRVNGLRSRPPGTSVNIAITFKKHHISAVEACRDSLRINTVPVINLYRREAVALRLKTLQIDYRIPEDASRPGPWDVFAVDSVRLASAGQHVEIREFYQSSTRGDVSQGIFWTASRVERTPNAHSHATTVLNFVDPQRELLGTGKHEVAFVDVSCSSSESAELVPAGDPLSLTPKIAGVAATMAVSASPYCAARISAAESSWILLSGASLRSLSREGRSTWTDIVKRHLMLHDRVGSRLTQGQIDAIREIAANVVVKPMQLNECVMAPVTRYELRIDEPRYVSGSKYLMARVVHAMLTHMRGLNQQIELVAHGVSDVPVEL